MSSTGRDSLHWYCQSRLTTLRLSAPHQLHLLWTLIVRLLGYRPIKETAQRLAGGDPPPRPPGGPALRGCPSCWENTGWPRIAVAGVVCINTAPGRSRSTAIPVMGSGWWGTLWVAWWPRWSTSTARQPNCPPQTGWNYADGTGTWPAVSPYNTATARQSAAVKDFSQSVKGLKGFMFKSFNKPLWNQNMKNVNTTSVYKLAQTALLLIPDCSCSFFEVPSPMWQRTDSQHGC